MDASACISTNPCTEALQRYFPDEEESTVMVRLGVLPTTCGKENNKILVFSIHSNEKKFEVKIERTNYDKCNNALQ